MVTPAKGSLETTSLSALFSIHGSTTRLHIYLDVPYPTAPVLVPCTQQPYCSGYTWLELPLRRVCFLTLILTATFSGQLPYEDT